MENPIIIPPEPLEVTEEQLLRAEKLVKAVLQVFKNGTLRDGVLVDIPPILVPKHYDSEEVIPLNLSEEKEQLFYKQLGIAIARESIGYANQTTAGITRLSSDPSVPDAPKALNSEEVHLLSNSSGVPRAGLDGKIDISWIPGGTPVPLDQFIFEATCTSADAVGDLVRIVGPSKSVTKINISDYSEMPTVGCIISKATSTDCAVQCVGIVSGIYSGLEVGKIYFAGENGRPSRKPVAPIPGSPYFMQGIGFSIDANQLFISPNTHLIKVIG